MLFRSLLFLPVWAGAIVYVAEIVLIVLANILLYDKGIYYVPIVEFIIFISGTFIVLCVFKQLFARLNMKNLPIDAVIRFSDAIINIDHSVSYSEYLMKNRSEIEQDLSASLLLPVMDKNSFMLKELAAENHRNKNFGIKFWEYVKQAGYEHCNKSTGTPQFYRFSHPSSKDYPSMIELFSRKSDIINLPENAVLTPLSIDDDISSLSAILLNDEYYEFLKQGRIVVDGVSVLKASYLIPFKAKAWIDLTYRKSLGEQVDSKNIKKHKNDVFRLIELIDPSDKINVSKGVYDDIQEFVKCMLTENVDVKQLGLVERNK